MSNRMYCPHCREIITRVDMTATYSCRTYGDVNGTRRFQDGYDDYDEHENNDSDDYDYDEHRYSCPECDEVIAWDDIEECEESDHDIYDPNGDDEERNPPTFTAPVIRRATGSISLCNDSIVKIAYCKHCHQAMGYIEEEIKFCPFCGEYNN